jgi:hypothetical protein
VFHESQIYPHFLLFEHEKRGHPSTILTNRFWTAPLCLFKFFRYRRLCALNGTFLLNGGGEKAILVMSGRPAPSRQFAKATR